MISYFTVTHKLLEKQDGKLVPFEKNKQIYASNVVAKTADEAIRRLKDDFHMLTVEVVSISEKQEMTDEEYANG